MKKLMLSLVMILGLGLTTATAQNDKSQEKSEAASYEDMSMDPRNKTTITPQELPPEVRRDITDNYHNPQILKAYRLSSEGELSGYLVEVKKGTKKWTIEFDQDGNAVNKVNPL